MRVNILGLGLAMLIVLVQLNRSGASLSTSKETTTPLTLLGEDDMSLGSSSKSQEKTNKERTEDEKFARQVEPKNAPSTERNLKPPNISGELENGRKNKSEDHPLFRAYPFYILIPDDQPVSSVLGKVEAADPTNQGRKCFYRLHLKSSIPDLFSVDTETGVITTKTRLDTVDDHPPDNITNYIITIYTAFYNFTNQSLYDGKPHLESIFVGVAVVHGPLRLFGEHDKISAPFLCDEVALISAVANIVFAMVIVGLILVNFVATRSDNWKIKGNDSPPPPTCLQVTRNFLKRFSKHHCGDNQKERKK